MTRHEVLEKLLASADYHEQAHDIVTAIFGPKDDPEPEPEPEVPLDPPPDGGGGH